MPAWQIGSGHRICMSMTKKSGERNKSSRCEPSGVKGRGCRIQDKKRAEKAVEASGEKR